MPQSKDTSRPGRATGPRTPAGKQRSSQNAITHGMRSRRRLLQDEVQEEYDALREIWMAEYADEATVHIDLIEELVDDHWLLKRGNRWVFEAQRQNDDVDPDPRNWSEEQHQHLQLMQRYRTTAKRDFHRSWRALEQLRGSRKREAVLEERRLWQIEARAEKQAKTTRASAFEAQRAEEKPAQAAGGTEKKAGSPQTLTPAGQLFQGQNSPKKRKKIHCLEQWVEVTIQNGQTVTTLYPSNTRLIGRGKTMWPAPDYVYRRVNFPHGVPPEYDWTGVNENRRQFGGCAIQRMTPDTWLAVIQREGPEEARLGYRSSIAPNHIGPTGVGNLPRPAERGGCECPVCERNQGTLDRRELEGVMARKDSPAA